jgi:hypothetical protein
LQPSCGFAREAEGLGQKIAMFHSNTALLIDYWRSKKGAASALARSDIDPADLVWLLPRVFMAERWSGGYRLRLAGQFITDAHPGARAGHDFLALWRADDRPALRRTLDRALANPAPVVIAAQTEAERGHVINLEIAFTPVAMDGEPANRFLGLYQSLGAVRAGRPAGALRLRHGGDGAGDAPFPRPRLAAVDGRLIA